jgi:DNA-binding IclR family transcriptional regulator
MADNEVVKNSGLEASVEDSESEKETKAAGIQSLEIGIDILKALARSEGPISLTALSAAVGLPASSCRRYLISLIRTGLVRQEGPSGKYDTGPDLLRLGLLGLTRWDAVRATVDRALLLNQEVDQTTMVSVLGDRGPTVIAWFDSRRKLIVNSHLGSVYPLRTTATGRVFLSYLPSEAVRDLLKAEDEPGDMRAGSKAAIEAVVRETRERSYASIDGDVVPGISALSAPVLDAQGKLVAAITIMGISDRYVGESASTLIEALRRTAAQASEENGFPSASTGRSYAAWLAQGWRGQ